ncbi:hypothetical protein [Mesorhizobium sp. SP-1A]|uniref:hypothetical protein n=1 Tax=Mesorhizobium sp. SP-1A TaxID=3077840 RepID=UPI0028F70B9F|nr:hypothetical protein [Mesorhizobium sp. SP-1A]
MFNNEVNREFQADLTVGSQDVVDERNGDWIQTYCSRQFWALDPRPEDFDIRDIAHALSMICRFNGHCLRFYSVAEHSILMAIHFIKKGEYSNALWALLHDGTEAYLCDVPRPIKPYLTGYKEVEDSLMSVIATRFMLDGDIMPKAVKDVDYAILFAEAAQNMGPAPEVWSSPVEPLNVKLQYWTPEQAERNFLLVYEAITNPEIELDYELIFANDNKPAAQVDISDIVEVNDWLKALDTEGGKASLPRQAIEALLSAARANQQAA